METQAYDADQIDILEGIEHVRKRPAMYIPDTSKAGLHHLVKEVIDNSIDEWLQGHGDTIGLELDANGAITVSDNARGIPVEIHAKTGKPTVTSIFTQLFSGGKFSGKAYSASAGLHGVGVTVVNALSEWLVVTVYREGKQYIQKFEQGKENGGLVQGPKYADGRSGTEVTFLPDSTIFDTTDFDIAILRKRLEQSSYLCKGLIFRLIDPDGNKEEFVNHEGIKALVGLALAERKGTLITDTFVHESKTLEIALAWKAGATEHCKSFVNVTPVPEGGTHVTGMRRAITKVLGAFAKDNAKYTSDDLRDGLIVAIHCRVANPQFKGQAKHRLQNKDTDRDVYNELVPVLEKWFNKHKESAKDIVNRAIALADLRSKAKKQKAALNALTKPKKTRGVLPGKLVEAPFAKPADRELFILEGDSASGSAKRARNSKYQEVLPLRGKILNSAGQDLIRILKNNEINGIIAAIGSGIDTKNSTCSPKDARVGKVLLLMDADPDGQHIASLILTFVLQYMSPLIAAGMIYVVDSPLYIAHHGGKRYFGHALADIKGQLPSNAKYHVTRLKGHGEANAADLREYAFDPSTRRLYQLQLGSNDTETVLHYMGSDAEARREILGIST